MRSESVTETRHDVTKNRERPLVDVGASPHVLQFVVDWNHSQPINDDLQEK